MATTVGQYCIYVNDIELSARFYSEIIGLEVQGHTEIDDVHEIVLAAASGGGRLQLAERYNGRQPIDHGSKRHGPIAADAVGSNVGGPGSVVAGQGNHPGNPAGERWHIGLFEQDVA